MARSLNYGGSGRNHCTTQQLVPVLLASLFSFFYYDYYYNPTSFSAPKLETETPSTGTHMAATTGTHMAATTSTITTSMEEEIFGVKIERNPPESKLTHLAVTSWPKLQYGVPLSLLGVLINVANMEPTALFMSDSHPLPIHKRACGCLRQQSSQPWQGEPKSSDLNTTWRQSSQWWGCSPSKFPWTFTAKETMYLLEGKVKVYCDGYDGSFEIGAGDLVEFPKGMKVTWDVTEAVNKHYSLDDN
ncbi:hypothetical protein LguiB_024539 [Lonicera macranthoides]